MILRCFSILDTKTGMFNVPFFFSHQGQAIRACMDIGRDLSTTIGRYPSDFALFDLGSFNDQNGELVMSMPNNLGSIASFLDPVVPPMPVSINPQPRVNGEA